MADNSLAHDLTGQRRSDAVVELRLTFKKIGEFIPVIDRRIFATQNRPAYIAKLAAQTRSPFYSEAPDMRRLCETARSHLVTFARVFQSCELTFPDDATQKSLARKHAEAWVTMALVDAPANVNRSGHHPVGAPLALTIQRDSLDDPTQLKSILQALLDLEKELTFDRIGPWHTVKFSVDKPKSLQPRVTRGEDGSVSIEKEADSVKFTGNKAALITMLMDEPSRKLDFRALANLHKFQATQQTIARWARDIFKSLPPSIQGYWNSDGHGVEWRE